MHKILFVFSGHDSSYNFQEARQKLDTIYNNEFQLNFLDTNKIDESEEEFEKCNSLIKESDFIFLCVHAGFSYFKRFDSFMEACKNKKIFVHSGIDDEINELIDKTGLSQEEYRTIYRYYMMGGKENSFNLILWLAVQFKGAKYEVKEPLTPKWEGIYDIDKEISDEKAYIETLKNSEKPVVGVLFYVNNKQNDNLLHIDSIIKTLKSQGAIPLPVYTSVSPNESLGSKGVKWVIDNYFMKDGKAIIDVLINTAGFSLSILSNPGDGTKTIEESVFEKLGVPVLQAINTYFTLEQWQESLMGIDMMSLSSNVYHPEFDGQIITVPIAYSDVLEDDIGRKRIFRPIEERVQKVCRMAMNWAKLRKLSNSKKKVAIIFHNMPPRNDMIGCAYGLDSPETVYNIVEKLKEIGIATDYDFTNGENIIQKIINTVTNDSRWLTPETMVDKSIDTISANQYKEWFNSFGEKVQEKMIKDWGEPPGDFMVSDDKFPVPGILNGNIFIGLQPPRAFEEKAEEVYHSTDIVCPHQYLAFYKWIKEIFKADIIMHIGTHGTLEWLPGKEIGLSKDCYPDLAIGDMPHLYLYIINVPGEGVQTKRRSYSVVLDHLIPSMVESDTYDDLALIEDMIKEYYHSKKANKGKLPHLEKQIWSLAEKMELHQDISIIEEEAKANFENFIEKLHSWIGKIKSSLIKDGLHIYGQKPPGERYKNMLRALVRLKNDEVPALEEALALAKGYDYENLLDNPNKLFENGKTALMLLDDLRDIGKNLLEELEINDYKEENILEIIEKVIDGIDGDLNPLKNCLAFICNDLKPRLDATTDELKYLVKGVNGEFVAPGPSGCPTRGRSKILPTGRNFYTIDPAAVPTRASWEVGKKLGEDLIKRYIKDEGNYPESIAIVIYAGETMKTCGDDIAEIFYLMGIKPKWLGNTDRVVGLEVIPLEELRRPRIDITLRISGLFRDTFPNLIGFVEDAVTLAAGQEEDFESNYVRKHILNEVEELTKQGLKEEEARAQASLRIFGCPPGTYGAGVDILINSKKWTDVKDLGNVYTLWGGNAYGRKIHGENKKEAFAKRLANTNITVKNESSMETDIYDDDCYYNYHGGMIAAVRTHSGKKPRSYCGDSSNPERTELRDTNEETARVMRARLLNPKWIDGLKKHGYKGAQEVSAVVDRAFGWDATADTIEDWMYDKITDHYVLNKENKEWIKESNPWALHNIVERLMEANKREMWNANDEYLNKLRDVYLEVEGDVEEHI